MKLFSTYDILLFVLMLTMMLCVVWQLYQPRITIVGILSILAALGFTIITAINGDLTMFSVILFIAGLIFLIAELFIVGAVLGIIGAGLIVGSFLLIGEDLSKMAIFVSLSLIVVLIEWGVIVKFLGKKIPFLNKVILTDATTKEAGYSSYDDRSYLVGKTAITLTAFRPAGIIMLDGKRIDAVSDGLFIDKDKTVEIIHVEGTRVVVREIK